MSDTQVEITARMLSYIDDTYDKSEGQFIFDVLSAVARELSSSYESLNQILDQGFAETATAKNLDKKVEEYGLERKKAKAADGYVKVTGSEGAYIVQGEMVASDELNYIFQENSQILNGEAKVRVLCQQTGTVGNVAAGAIKYFPKTLQGLSGVTNEEAFNNGYDEESDEDLRQRYYVKVRTPATSGNVYHYKNWAMSVVGVGGCKIVPLWNGNGTVKVIILNSNKKSADEELVNNVYNYIEEQRPIGATVTVVSAIEKMINISVKLSIENGYSQDVIKENIEKNIERFLASIAFQNSYISYAKIGAIILGSEGVQDYSNLLINNAASNININDEEVCVLGEVSIG